MAHAARALALAALLLLAGCAAIPGTTTMTADVEPRLAGTFSSGGTCVDAPRVGLRVTSETAEGVLTVHVAGNVTVPGAHYAIESFELSRDNSSTYRLDVNTTGDTGKPVRDCEVGGIAPYEATVELPADTPFGLQIRHDGVPQADVGSGAES